jgi:hypothetical protein
VWSYKDKFLPATFHKKTGVSSISQLYAWLRQNPLAPFNGQDVSYARVESTILTLGMALRDIRTVAFLEPDATGDFPDYIRCSPFEVQDYEQLLSECAALLPKR